MAGSRSLTPTEEKLLIRSIRRIGARDRALVTTQLMTGFRISEVLSLTVGQVLDVDGLIRAKIGVRPKNLKGHYGSTRWIPVCPELQRALENYLTRRAKQDTLTPDAPLFLSREHHSDGTPKSLSRSGAEKLIRTILRRVGQGDLETLSTHSLRKTWARKLYEASGHDLIVVKEGLNHSSVSVTQVYLSCDRQRLDAFILKGDRSRRREIIGTPPPKIAMHATPVKAPVQPKPAPLIPAPANTPATATAVVTDFLPGLAAFAA